MKKITQKDIEWRELIFKAAERGYLPAITAVRKARKLLRQGQYFEQLYKEELISKKTLREFRKINSQMIDFAFDRNRLFHIKRFLETNSK